MRSASVRASGDVSNRFFVACFALGLASFLRFFDTGIDG
jgi:hypothetical protein